MWVLDRAGQGRVNSPRDREGVGRVCPDVLAVDCTDVRAGES